MFCSNRLIFMLGFLLLGLSVSAKETIDQFQVKVLNQIEDLDQSLKDLSQDPDVISQLNSFFQNQEEKYSQEITIHLHQQLKNKLGNEIKKTECAKKRKVFFPSKMTSFESGQKFEKEIIQIETTDCLQANSAEQIFKTLNSEDFLLKNIEGLTQVSFLPSDNLICQMTNVSFVGKSNYCFKQDIFHLGDHVIAHSYNVVNKQPNSAMVYYREVLTLIQKMDQNGRFKVYTFVFGRGPDLPFHFIVNMAVEKQHQAMIQALQYRLLSEQ